jgi:hypothetical protein
VDTALAFARTIEGREGGRGGRGGEGRGGREGEGGGRERGEGRGGEGRGGEGRRGGRGGEGTEGEGGEGDASARVPISLLTLGCVRADMGVRADAVFIAFTGKAASAGKCRCGRTSGRRPRMSEGKGRPDGHFHPKTPIMTSLVLRCSPRIAATSSDVQKTTLSMKQWTEE